MLYFSCFPINCSLFLPSLLSKYTSPSRSYCRNVDYSQSQRSAASKLNLFSLIKIPLLSFRELSQEKSHLILVMECGSIDLAGFLRKNRTKITENELQVFWRQMLEAVHVIHEARIIHSDLKPANFLLVEGRLKLIDFGIANALQVSRTDTTKF